MAFEAVMTYRGIPVAMIGVAGVRKRLLQKAIKRSWTRMGEWYVRNIRQKKVTHAGAREYGYIPRTGEKGSAFKRWAGTYTARKSREKGHMRPMEWSGESIRLAMIETFSASFRRLKIKNKAANWRFRPWQTKYARRQIPMPDEAREVSNAEFKRLTQVLAGALHFNILFLAGPLYVVHRRK